MIRYKILPKMKFISWNDMLSLMKLLTDCLWHFT